MAGLAWEGTRARITFRDSAGKQKSLRLGECAERAARNALAGFERVLEANRLGETIHPDGLRWLEKLDDRIHGRVVALGLAQPRLGAAVMIVSSMLDQYIARLAVKPQTKYKYVRVAESLRAFLGPTTPLAAITTMHADEWRMAIAEPKGTMARAPARASVAKQIVIAKGVFGKAVRWRMIPASPFADLKAGSQVNSDRAFYVSHESIRAILAACPDDQWRGIIGLARFAGLRCPSELVGLKWGDVAWDVNRMTVRSPKTAGHEGHATRVVPIAPELRTILQSLFDVADDGAEAVIPRLRDPKTNLRTQFERIMARAGVKPWPRLFHNMRASCACDWVERFPNHVVAAWLGHSPMIASMHYLQTRDVHFDLAAGIESVEKAVANPATHTRKSGITPSEPKTQKPRIPAELVGFGVACDRVEYEAMPPEGLEPSTR